MRVLLLTNTSSGSGRAARASQSLARALAGAGHDPLLTDPRADDLAAALRAADAVVVLGGDGTVHHALPLLARVNVPLYHCPLGTENLFARQFRMSASPAAILTALHAPVSHIDLGECNGRPFAIMLSVGPDAGVIHRLTRARTGPISHASYVRPVLAEAIRPTLGPLHVDVDHTPFVTGQRGLLVLANTRQYALRLDPAPRARADDARLDVVFFPASSSLRVALGLCLARLRLHIRAGLARAASAQHITIRAPGLPVQADGEALPFDASNLSISTRPGALRVLAG
jgi:diacylglycerol kinase (ATP)